MADYKESRNKRTGFLALHLTLECHRSSSHSSSSQPLLVKMEMHEEDQQGNQPVYPRNTTLHDHVDDLVRLPYLNEPAVLHAIRSRYFDGDIYTYSGLVLAAVNPFADLPGTYNRSQMQAFRTNPTDNGKSPHVYAVAEAAYRQMLLHSAPQSIVISGESGAGKTVSARHIMRYLASVDKWQHAEHEAAMTEIERRILASNPILEAFGNARTIRNDNSSRFGKYLELFFESGSGGRLGDGGDNGGPLDSSISGLVISGANIRTYLLEKTRVVQQDRPGEHNYHVFYFLMQRIQEHGNGDEWGLDPGRDYRCYCVHYTSLGT